LALIYWRKLRYWQREWNSSAAIFRMLPACNEIRGKCLQTQRVQRKFGGKETLGSPSDRLHRQPAQTRANHLQVAF
jgi:hypothetical protein